jgi:lysophospholipase L1-like esterase
MIITSYVAIGDSFTEGLDDPSPSGAYRGWADRLAGRLSAALTTATTATEAETGRTRRPAASRAGSGSGFRYANLAVRGRLLHQVIDDQVPRAVEMAPDLVSLVAGGNDLLRPGADPDALASAFQNAVRRLRATGSEVLLFTGVDPRDAPLIRRSRGLVATYYLHIRSIADRWGCHLVDMWSMQALRDWRAWSIDRLHLSPEGHRRVAARACEVLGVAPADGDDWRTPWPPAGAAERRAARGDDLRWAREHLLPWIGRRLRGRSSGDDVTAKRPELAPFPEL